MLRFLEALARRLEYEPARRGTSSCCSRARSARSTRRASTRSTWATWCASSARCRTRKRARLQREADVLLLVRNEGPGYEAMVPGKLYEYLAARRPIVAMVGEGEAAELVRAAGRRVVAPDNGTLAVAQALAAALGSAGAPRPNERTIDALLEKRSRRALAGELARHLDEARAARMEAR